ncbi:hypothetical protein A2U01_0077957, partial [Trifolium medium]|nr:hypothetical protein [Trifolium medium]
MYNPLRGSTAWTTVNHLLNGRLLAITYSDQQ